MKVSELQYLLSRADPDDLVIFDAPSDSLLLISSRSGMHQKIEDLAVFTKPTLREEEFLRAMHIKW